MKVIFSEFAKQELDDAEQFYELEYKGLGTEFRKEIQNSISIIVKYPEAWALIRDDI